MEELPQNLVAEAIVVEVDCAFVKVNWVVALPHGGEGDGRSGRRPRGWWRKGSWN